MLPKDTFSKVMVKEAINQLKTISKTVEIFREQMMQLAKQLPEYQIIIEIYGVDNSLGPQLMAEIGDVTRFAHKGSLVAFAGVDPGANQSGTKEIKSNKSSKRGSHGLRKTLFILMTILLQKTPLHDTMLKFLDKKRAEGKPYYI